MRLFIVAPLFKKYIYYVKNIVDYFIEIDNIIMN